MAEIFALDGIAIVTGAATGIGQATAFLFAEVGCKAVVFADRNLEGAQKSAEESRNYKTHLGYEALAIHVDVASMESVQRMVKIAVDRFGRIDYSVNSAGIGNSHGKPVSQLDFDHFDKVIDINLRGTANCVSAVAAQMATQEPKTYEPTGTRSSRIKSRNLGRGSIVNLGSVNSHSTQPNTFAYTTAKHGVIGVTKAAAMDHARDGIRVNAICPGAVDTPMMEAAFERNPKMRAMSVMIPLGKRMADPDEIASAIVFLCSPGSSYTTGTSQLVDAGFSLMAARTA